MGHLDQLKAALDSTIKLTKSADFRQYSKDEQDFFRSYVRELNEEINAEYEAIAFVAQRERDKQHEAL
jgi:hypothetical protein